MSEEVCFNLTEEGCSWKGVFFGEMDNDSVDAQLETPEGFKTPSWYRVGVMALIWTDKSGIWHVRARMKFPGGNKQVIQKSFDPREHSNLNETKLLQELYELPMVNKRWLPNPSGIPEGIIELIEGADMTESKRFECPKQP